MGTNDRHIHSHCDRQRARDGQEFNTNTEKESQRLLSKINQLLAVCVHACMLLKLDHLPERVDRRTARRQRRALYTTNRSWRAQAVCKDVDGMRVGPLGQQANILFTETPVSSLKLNTIHLVVDYAAL